MATSYRFLSSAFLALVLCVAANGQMPKDFAVMLNANVTNTPQVRITLRWNADTAQQKVYIWKKLKTDATFPVVIHDSVIGKETRWTDAKVQEGVAYEYRVFRLMRRQNGYDTARKEPTFAVFYGTGYIVAGIAAPPSPRDRALVLVDTTMIDALRSELDDLRDDLENEAWEVTIRGVPRAEAFDSSAVRITRDLIKQEWRDGEQDVRAIFLVGRVAVPYAGNIVPDGHPDHQGAWPADGIYGDVNGTYTDNITTSPTTVRPANRNAPRDGKFDQSQFASDVDIAVGRVDFYNMPAFTKSELELVRDYLSKNHAYRTNRWTVVPGGIIDDNFGTYGEVFAASGWRSFGSFAEDTATRAGDFFTDLAGPRVLQWAYGCGGGTNTSAGGIGNTSDMASRPVNAVFTLLFGSYFGDYDTEDNFLRAAIASSPRVLTCAWSGRPHWYMHHMALGETVGYSTRISQNNRVIVSNNFGNYVPNITQTAQGGLSIASSNERTVHIALMGDPTLRIATKPVAVLNTLTVQQGPWNTQQLTWLKPTGDAQAYMVYRRKGGDRRWTQLTSYPITTTSYIDTIVHEGTLEYMVRCCALRTSASGTYYDIGKGRQASVTTTSVDEPLVAQMPVTVTVAPQPATALTSIALFLPTPTNVSLQLLDVRGSVVWTQEQPTLMSGKHTLSIDASMVATGIYTLVLYTSSGSTSQQFVVAR